MIGGGEGYIVLEKVGKFLGEGRSKLWSPIRDYFGMKTESWENMGEKELGDSGGIYVFSAGAINCYVDCVIKSLSSTHSSVV